MKQTAEEMLDKIEGYLETINQKLEKRVHLKEESKKKNSHLHIFIDTSLMNKLREESSKKGTSISELVRQKLRENNQLDRIENKLDKLRLEEDEF